MSSVPDIANVPALVGAGPPAELAGQSASQALDFAHMTLDTALCLQSAGREYRVSAKDIIKWIAPQAPPSDAVKLLVIAQATGLNPMLGEIELILFSGKWTPSIRKNGYVKIAQRSPEYDGHESGVVIQPFRTEPKTNAKIFTGPPEDVPGTIVPRGYLLVGGWAKFYRKGISRPVYKRVSLNDYGRDTGAWKTLAPTMIEKVAIAQACREAFPVGETYDEAEAPAQPAMVVRQASLGQMGTDAANAAEVNAALAAQQAPAAGPTNLSVNHPTDGGIIDVETEAVIGPGPATAEQVAEITDLFTRIGADANARAGVLAKRGVETISALDRYEAQQIINRLTEIASRKEWNPLEKAESKQEAETETAAEPETAEVETAAVAG